MMGLDPLDNFDGIDEGTARLILELSLTDVEAILRKGKVREGELTDVELAMRLFKQELEQRRQLLADRRMASSIAQAVQVDGHLIHHEHAADEEALRDRELARQLQNNHGDTELAFQPAINGNPGYEELDDELLTKLETLYMCEDASIRPESDGGESASRMESRSASQPPDSQCVACQETKRFFDVIRAPCQHEYCRDCIEDLIRHSMIEESLFPPRCCRQPIPIPSVAVRLLVSSQLINEFLEKKIEIETPNRTYCYRLPCSAFIPTASISDDIGECAQCHVRTCTHCKGQAHGGDCHADVALEQTLDVARTEGWQRCFTCRAMVELNTGCNYMTCVSRML